MEVTKLIWGTTGGRTYKHFVFSYHAKEPITPEQAHKNAIELAEGTAAWKGFEVLIATHIDRDHIHTHLIVNSVNFEDGHKLRWSKADLRDLKDRCVNQSLAQGLSVPEKGKTFEGKEREETQGWNKDTHWLLKRAEQGKVRSYVRGIAIAVVECLATAASRDEFVSLMSERGYRVDWQENRKYITFTDLAREAAGEKTCKVRNNKLGQYYNLDLGKEALGRIFDANQSRRDFPEKVRGMIRDLKTARRETAGEKAELAAIRKERVELPIWGFKQKKALEEREKAILSMPEERYQLLIEEIGNRIKHPKKGKLTDVYRKDGVKGVNAYMNAVLRNAERIASDASASPLNGLQRDFLRNIGENIGEERKTPQRAVYEAVEGDTGKEKPVRRSVLRQLHEKEKQVKARDITAPERKRERDDPEL